MQLHREEIVRTTAQPLSEVCATSRGGGRRSVKRLPSRWCQKSGAQVAPPAASPRQAVSEERQRPRTAAQLRALVRKIDTKGDVNSTVKLRHLLGSPQMSASRTSGTIDFTNHLAAYRLITGSDMVMNATERKRASGGLKNFSQFKSFLDKACASMKNASSFLNDYTRFSKTDVTKVLTLMIRDSGYRRPIMFTKYFQENINLFLMNFMAKIGMNMCLIAGCTRRALSNNGDLGILQESKAISGTQTVTWSCP